MALLHQAEVRPSKLELLTSWLPTRPWSDGHLAGPLERVGGYRFDDPAGEVGIETLLIRAGGGDVLQVPMTYRGAPLHGSEQSLIGTLSHSVLGTRWVYDGCADPVYATAVANAVLSGGTQAEETFIVDGKPRQRQPDVTVRGSGTAQSHLATIDSLSISDRSDTTVLRTPALELVIRRVLTSGDERTDGQAGTGWETLAGSWNGEAQPVVLVLARPA